MSTRPDAVQGAIVGQTVAGRDIWAYRTPILHTSDRARTPTRRRVLQVDPEWVVDFHGTNPNLERAPEQSTTAATGKSGPALSVGQSQVLRDETGAPRALPALQLNPDVDDLFAFTFDDIAIEGYEPAPAIRAPVAV